MRISVLSNINLDSLVNRLKGKYDVYKPDGYGIWMQELLNNQSELYHFQPDVVFIIIDCEELYKGLYTKEAICEKTTQHFSYLSQVIVAHPTVSFFVSTADTPIKKIKGLKEFGFERYIEYAWNQNLLELNDKYDNIFLMDLKRLVEAMGRNDFYSDKLWYLGGMKYSMKAEKSLDREIDRLLNGMSENKKKCIILDLDNTLWGGVIGEDLFCGIRLAEYKDGAQYKDFQKRLKELKELGVILCIASKNNYDDAIEVIKNHQHMVLKEEDFVILKINWNNKAQNIKEIAHELNIGLDSVVFIDDSIIERENVKKALPQVVVPEFPKDTAELEKFITEIYYDYFYTLKITSEDAIKTKLYKTNIERMQLMESSSSYEDFLKSLDTKVTVKKVGENDILRITQLIHKTNQFNLTTRRYTETDVREMAASDKYLFLGISVEDRFGDNGVVGVVILEMLSQGAAAIDSFILSCRVMGRHIEDLVITLVEKLLLESCVDKLYSYYIPTKKNKPVESLFERLGYDLIEINGNQEKKYCYNLKNNKEGNRKLYGSINLL